MLLLYSAPFCRDALGDGDFAPDVPLLTGVTSEEGSWYTADIFGPANVDARLREINRNVTAFLEMLCGFRSFRLEVRTYGVDSLRETNSDQIGKLIV